ncbi:hypothetical protein ACA910_015910 [Epithemia clementina (nom. ined.)]
MSKTAEELKELGNKAFGDKNFNAAAQYYSEAIQLDPKNHVLFSNRSASYASLQKYEKADSDAKECIRLDPTFVKVYYRLVTAQIGLKQYDLALATIRQGLAVDNDNTQLVKQQRMVQQLKRSHEATVKKRQEQASKTTTTTTALSSTTSMPSGSEQFSSNSELQEIMTQYTQTKREFETEKINLSKLEREEKITDLTRQELVPLPEEQRCYRSVGKMFLLSTKEQVIRRLDTTIQESQKKQDELQQKIAYLERKMQSQQQNMVELQTQTPAAE